MTPSSSARAASRRSRQPVPSSTGLAQTGFRFRPLTEPDARQIASWRYPAPYDFYDLPEEAWSDLLGLGQDFQAVDLAPGTVLPERSRRPAGRPRWPEFVRRVLGRSRTEAHPVVATDAALAGFVCFGPEAQVLGARNAGHYAQDALDIGIGLRPDLTGRGLGGDFFAACLDHALRTRQQGLLRLAVAAFNTRAIAVYTRAGFRSVARCQSPVRGRPVEFVIMVRD